MSKAKEAKSASSATEPATGQPADNAPEAAASEPSAPAADAGVPPQELEELKAQAAKAIEHWDRLLRVTADFDNFRKRTAREKQEAIKYANEALMTKLIPVLDSFAAALAAAASAPDPTAESLRTGIAMVQQQLKAALTEAGLEEVNAAGQVFDPNWHEAISQQECAEMPEGHVLQQLRIGYKLRDRLLRPATVIVAKSPTPSATTAA